MNRRTKARARQRAYPTTGPVAKKGGIFRTYRGYFKWLRKQV